MQVATILVMLKMLVFCSSGRVQKPRWLLVRQLKSLKSAKIVVVWIRAHYKSTSEPSQLQLISLHLSCSALSTDVHYNYVGHNAKLGQMYKLWPFLRPQPTAVFCAQCGRLPELERQRQIFGKQTVRRIERIMSDLNPFRIGRVLTARRSGAHHIFASFSTEPLPWAWSLPYTWGKLPELRSLFPKMDLFCIGSGNPPAHDSTHAQKTKTFKTGQAGTPPKPSPLFLMLNNQ